MKPIYPVLLVIVTCLAAAGQGTTGYDAQGDALPAGAIARLGSHRFRHDAAITSQAVTRDGKLMATGGGRSVRVWDAQSGRQLHALAMNIGGRAVTPSAVAFSQDGQMLTALASYGTGMLMVWDLRGGQTRQELMLPQREDSTNSLMESPFLAFGPTNQQVVVKNYADKSVQLFDLPNGSLVHSFSDANASITCLAVSPHGRWLAAGTDRKEVILWDLQSGKELKRFPHDYPLVSVSFSPNNEQLATLDQDLAPRIWDIAQAKAVQTLSARTRSNNIAWSTNGQALYIARQPDEILRWDLQSKVEKSIKLKSQSVKGPLLPLVNKDSKEIVLIGSAGRLGVNTAKVNLVDLQQSDLAERFDGYESYNFYPLYIADKKQWSTMSTTGDGVLRYWDQAGRNRHSVTLPLGQAPLKSFAISSRGQMIALSGNDGMIHLIDAAGGKLLRTIAAFPRSCYDTEFTSDGKYVVATDLRFVKRFDCASGALIHSFELQSVDSIRTVISQDGSRVVTLHYDQDLVDQIMIRILDAATGKVMATDNKQALYQQSFFVAPDGRNLMVLANRVRPNKVEVYEAASGKLRFQVALPQSYEFLGNSARISADGRWLASSASGTEADQSVVLLWQLGISRDPIILTGHRGVIASCHFSTDSKQLLTVSQDATMLVWDMQKQMSAAGPSITEKDYLKYWQELGSDDAVRAYTAVQRWARQPASAEWLGNQIRESSTLTDLKQLQDWVQQLSAAKYQDRESATKMLSKHAVVAKKTLQAALEQATSAEAKRRLSQILEKANASNSLSDNPLLLSRALEALELMNDPQGLAQLQTLATRNDALGKEAQEAVLRLQARLK